MKLEEIRQRVAAATAGPWSPNSDINYDRGKARLIWGPKGPGYGSIAAVQVDYPNIPRENDCIFIANARQDIPWLISEIDRLNSGIDSVLYDLRNEDITDPNVVESIAENLVAVLNGK
ncbi:MULTISPECIES: hypothetical protein [Bacillus]|uniref:hypothetical protein n=1 Tax=Bacillus TaxID=1386 RepID=UPI0009329F24|nr:hypothetical protein [Bacillus licheniformis]MDK7626367.1 hypothetical protein [Bacillus licheniformis]OJT55208.1 hypothetical protein BFP49_23175 [Bacillus licheniformis]